MAWPSVRNFLLQEGALLQIVKGLSQLGLRVHVEAADADVFGAGDAGQVGAVEVDVNDEARALEPPPLVPVGPLEARALLLRTTLVRSRDAPARTPR